MTPRRPWLWITTLLSGLLSFVLLSTLEQNIRTALQSRARELLGGDLGISSRRWLAPSELERARKALAEIGRYRETELLEFFSMVSTSGKTPQLTELVAVRPEYPLVGTLTHAGKACSNASSSCVFGDSSLQLRWSLDPEKSFLQVGDARLLWSGPIERDTSRSLRGSSFAPRLFVGRDQLARTGLLRAGATFTVRHLFAFDTPPSAELLQKLAARLDHELTDPGIQIQTPKDASQDEGRLLSNVADYLGLTSLVGWLLSFLGCNWLLRRIIQQEARNWAILRVLSPRPYQADIPFWTQTLKISGIAAAAALLISQALWAMAGPWISRFLFLHDFLPSGLSWPTVFSTLGLAAATNIIALWPSLDHLKRQNLAELLKNPEVLAQTGSIRTKHVVVIGAVLFGFARGLAHSWNSALIFLGTVGAAALVLLLLAWGALIWMERLAPRARLGISRWSLLSLSRLRSSSILVWMTLALGALLLTLMPTLESSIRQQIRDPREAGPVPSLFLFDIQEEQLEPLQTWANSEGTALQFLTPLIRGRLLKVNGKPFEKMDAAPSTREEEREARFRNRGINLTYRTTLSPSERLVAGQAFSELGARGADSPEAVSVEKRFAERVGIRLEDLLEFEIQGVTIQAKVVNLRHVQWTSFQPNFFITFEPRALLDAPKSYLASLPKTTLEKRESLQSSLFEQFPNVSSIDVSQLMETLLEGFSQISQALRLMALVASVAGFAAVFSVLRLRITERNSELQLLKLLGVRPDELQKELAQEGMLLAGASALSGVVLSSAVAATLSLTIFDSPPALPPLFWSVSVLVGFTLIGGLLGRLTANSILTQEPQDWLKGLQSDQ